MERKEYDVTNLGDRVGHVSLQRQGLYWQITCCCSLPRGTMARLYASGTFGTVKLGLLCPEGNGFCLRTRVPMRTLDDDNLRFFLRERGTVRVPIVPDKEFAFLHALPRGKLVSENGDMFMEFAWENDENAKLMLDK